MGGEDVILAQESNDEQQQTDGGANESKHLTLNNLKIIPPESSNLAPVDLPPLRSDEPVASIRAALGELVGYAPFTNYKLVANGNILDDFGDLSGVPDNTEIALKLELYTNVREHVLRLMQLLQGNPPVVTALVGSSAEKNDEKAVDNNGKKGEASGPKKSKSKKLGKELKAGKDIPTIENNPIPASNDLNDFFEGATGLTDPNTEKLTKLEDSMRLPTKISFLAPPSAHRRLLGDLSHLRVDVTDTETLYITAVRDGFYRNKSTSRYLNPAPCEEPHLKHTLLDCLLECCPTFKKMWHAALEAAQERLAITSHDEPLEALYRVTKSNQASSLDAVFIRPSWIVPSSLSVIEEEVIHPTPALVPDTYGLDWTSGITRDWNEELQSAREMPVSSIHERLERARVIHKTLMDFGDSSYKAVKAIYDGQIQPMNPNEPVRSHVYLHNFIFISRAVDSGVETFKMSLGDKAAKKAASRDAQCMAMLHRMDVSGLHTLATVLVDYLGTRYVCQSVVPGILQGDKTHTLVYGAVEASANLTSTKEMHELLEKYVGKHAMCATRVHPTQPLTDERLAVIAELRTEPPLVNIEDENSKQEKTISVCGPIEGKGIKGSDQRNYVLDLTRLTPRDANWISESEGGTGKWEKAYKFNEFIPESLEDDEWIASILRHELVTQLTHQKMNEYLKAKDTEKIAANEEKDKADNDKEIGDVGQDGKKKEENKDQNDSSDDTQKKTEDSSDKLQEKKPLTPEDEKYLKSLRYNVNVFLPQLRSLKGIDDSAMEQVKLDEERAREAAVFLWDAVLPKLTQDIRQGDGNQLPVDGKSLIELLHQRGINCRYLGRLAFLASAEEVKDSVALSNVQSGKVKSVNRRIMPKSWLELLEIEMIARASKHVLDSYLLEEGSQILQVIASFMSALVTKGEETAGETERRLSKVSISHSDDEEKIDGLALASNVSIRSRKEVWDDIQREIGRRFRYKLTLYNGEKDSGRTSYVTLLRRICQRTGVRLAAKSYALGGKSLCSSEGNLIKSYPISPCDISDVVPLMKHAGALAGEGFVPCVGGASLPSLHILLPDAKATFEAAHFSYGARHLPQALDLAQEAAALYQRVVDGPIHLNIARCLDLTAAILFEAGEPVLAAANASRSLGLTVQLGGFDCAEAMTGHSTLSHILMTSQKSEDGIRHLKAAAYLMELLAGPRYVELANCYYKIGNFYQEKSGESALQYYKLALKCPHSDRLAEGMMAKGSALFYAKLEQYRSAVDAEKKALHLYSMLLGENHELTLNSQKSLQNYTRLAVQQGNKQIEQENLRKQEEVADAIASQIEAEEEQEQQKKKKNKGKKKK